MRNELEQERLKQLLHYDPETGVFTRLTGRNTGKVVGTRDTRGYTVINLEGKVYTAHRLAWLYVYGYFPPHHTDHINGDTEDNRINNLRETTAKQNIENRTRLNKNNKTGFRNVIFHKPTGKYAVYVKHRREQVYGGLYDLLEDAVSAAKALRDSLFTHHNTEHLI